MLWQRPERLRFRRSGKFGSECNVFAACACLECKPNEGCQGEYV